MTTIEQIHNEFFTASEKLITQAKAILEKPINEKAFRLEKAGFSVAQGVEEHKRLAEQQAKEKAFADMVNEYQMTYPNNKFITEEQVTRICKKYNLVCAPVARFKGFVPESKLKQIEAFTNVAPRHVPDKKIRITSVWNASNIFNSLTAKLIRQELGEFLDYDHPNIEYNGGQPWRIHASFGRYYISGYQEKKYERSICAPKKDFDLKGLSKLGLFFSSLTTHVVPDPVVLEPIKGGYLILAAWGDEAKDEDVVNQKFN